jgi:kumamolisin
MEVALDIEVAGAAFYVATGQIAQIRMYWSQDIASAVTNAAADGCDVCSISWGADEAEWGSEACEQMEAAALAATKLGMTIFAAAGDNDSSDGGESAANVDCPASCPSIVGCGGTNKTATSEVVWNDNPNQTDDTQRYFPYKHGRSTFRTLLWASGVWSLMLLRTLIPTLATSSSKACRSKS